MLLARLIDEEVRGLDDGQQREAKRAAATAAVAMVRTGMTLGLGTGSTVAFFLEGLAQRIEAEGLQVRGVPTSVATEQLAQKYGIPLVDPGMFPDLSNDLCVDGADRVDDSGHLIKGGGGALLREKMVAASSSRLCILVDATKLEHVFSDTFSLPVECLVFGIRSTMEHLRAQGCTPFLREKDGDIFHSDNGNCVVDCRFPIIADPAATQAALLAIPGVLEVGLFCEMMTTLILGRPDGSTRVAPSPG